MPRRGPMPPGCIEHTPMTPEQQATYDRQCKACAAWIEHLRRQIEAEDAATTTSQTKE